MRLCSKCMHIKKSLKMVCACYRFSAHNFAVPSAIGNVNFHLFLDINNSSAMSLRAWISDASTFPSSSMSATKISHFQILTATNAHPKNIPGKTFLPTWSNLLQISDDIQPPNGITRPLNGSPNRLSQGVFPSVERSWTSRRKE